MPARCLLTNLRMLSSLLLKNSASLRLCKKSLSKLLVSKHLRIFHFHWCFQHACNPAHGGYLTQVLWGFTLTGTFTEHQSTKHLCVKSLVGLWKHSEAPRGQIVLRNKGHGHVGIWADISRGWDNCQEHIMIPFLAVVLQLLHQNLINGRFLFSTSQAW